MGATRYNKHKKRVSDGYLRALPSMRRSVTPVGRQAEGGVGLLQVGISSATVTGRSTPGLKPTGPFPDIPSGCSRGRGAE